MNERIQLGNRDVGEVRALNSTGLSATVAPTRVLLAPWGDVESSNGSFIVDEESARLVIEAFDDHATDLPIDYEHQTLGGAYASPTGQAPAAGWIKRIVAEPGVGLLAEIEWTPQAAEMLVSRQYRYLSPVAVVRKEDRKLVAIHSAALTNKPAIVGMGPIVNRVLGEDAVEPLSRLKADLRLGSEVSDDAVLVAASERLTQLQREARAGYARERIREAMAAGKLVEVQRDWAHALILQDETMFDEWVRTAPVVVAPGRTVPPTGTIAASVRQQNIIARARSEYQTQPQLGKLTTEQAYVADALREWRTANSE